jgi:Flp pilus assembly pilin Flp
LSEYALLLALIVITGIAALTFLGGDIGNVLNDLAATLGNALG